MKYYAVKKGRHPGIYTTWKDCQKEVDHFKDAKYKSFDSKKEALAYLKQNNQKSSLHSKQETTNQRKQNKNDTPVFHSEYHCNVITDSDNNNGWIFYWKLCRPECVGCNQFGIADTVFWQVWILFSYVHMRRMVKIQSC